MNISITQNQDRFLGLLELDATGIVIYSEFDQDYTCRKIPNIVGQNFYTEIAPFSNTEELRYYINKFQASSLQFESFCFICNYTDRPPEPVRVSLARAYKSERDRNNAVTVVQIKIVESPT